MKILRWTAPVALEIAFLALVLWSLVAGSVDLAWIALLALGLLSLVVCGGARAGADQPIAGLRLLLPAAAGAAAMSVWLYFHLIALYYAFPAAPEPFGALPFLGFNTGETGVAVIVANFALWAFLFVRLGRGHGRYPALAGFFATVLAGGLASLAISAPLLPCALSVWSPDADAHFALRLAAGTGLGVLGAGGYLLFLRSGWRSTEASRASRRSPRPRGLTFRLVDLVVAVALTSVGMGLLLSLAPLPWLINVSAASFPEIHTWLALAAVAPLTFSAVLAGARLAERLGWEGTLGRVGAELLLALGCALAVPFPGLLWGSEGVWAAGLLLGWLGVGLHVLLTTLGRRERPGREVAGGEAAGGGAEGPAAAAETPRS